MYSTLFPVDVSGLISALLFNNNSIQFFIVYLLSQQLQGQLQIQHSVGKVVTHWTNTT
jgi:hypothetical protein